MVVVMATGSQATTGLLEDKYRSAKQKISLIHIFCLQTRLNPLTKANMTDFCVSHLQTVNAGKSMTFCHWLTHCYTYSFIWVMHGMHGRAVACNAATWSCVQVWSRQLMLFCAAFPGSLYLFSKVRCFTQTCMSSCKR